MSTLSSTEGLLEDVIERLHRVHRAIINTPGAQGSAEKAYWHHRLDDAYQGVCGFAARARPASLAWLMEHRAGSVTLLRKAILAASEVNQRFENATNWHNIRADLSEAQELVDRFEADLLRYDSYAGLVDEHFQIIQEIATVKLLNPLRVARDAYLTKLDQASLEAYTEAVRTVFSDDRFYYLELPEVEKRKMLERASTVFDQLTVGALVYELVNGERDE